MSSAVRKVETDLMNDICEVAKSKTLSATQMSKMKIFVDLILSGYGFDKMNFNGAALNFVESRTLETLPKELELAAPIVKEYLDQSSGEFQTATELADSLPQNTALQRVVSAALRTFDSVQNKIKSQKAREALTPKIDAQTKTMLQQLVQISDQVDKLLAEDSSEESNGDDFDQVLGLILEHQKVAPGKQRVVKTLLQTTKPVIGDFLTKVPQEMKDSIKDSESTDAFLKKYSKATPLERLMARGLTIVFSTIVRVIRSGD